jgi:hypothetical protein
MSQEFEGIDEFEAVTVSGFLAELGGPMIPPPPRQPRIPPREPGELLHPQGPLIQGHNGFMPGHNNGGAGFQQPLRQSGYFADQNNFVNNQQTYFQNTYQPGAGQQMAAAGQPMVGAAGPLPSAGQQMAAAGQPQAGAGIQPSAGHQMNVAGPSNLGAGINPTVQNAYMSNQNQYYGQINPGERFQGAQSDGQNTMFQVANYPPPPDQTQMNTGAPKQRQLIGSFFDHSTDNGFDHDKFMSGNMGNDQNDPFSNNNPNVPPGFGNQMPPHLADMFKNGKFNFAGLKVNLGSIGILGDTLLWEEWKMRVIGQLQCNIWAPVLDYSDCPARVWNVVKMWMIQWLNQADSQAVLACSNFPQAMETVRVMHSPDDNSTIAEVTRKIWTAKLGSTEKASSMINRILQLHATLHSLGKPFHEIQLVSAIQKALESNTQYKQTIDTLKVVGGHLTLRALQNAFNSSISTLSVPGAFLCEEDNQPDHMSNLSDQVAYLTKSIKTTQNMFKKARFDANPVKEVNGQPAGRGYRGGRAGRGHRGGRGGRGGRTGRGEKRQLTCFNCAGRNHTIDECKKPCGICDKPGHKANTCFKNPRSSNYKGKKSTWTRGQAKLGVELSSEGDEYEHGEAAAHSAQGTEHCYPFTETDLCEPADIVEGNDLPNPPDCHLPTMGIASKASVLDKNIDQTKRWILDTGASHHMTPEKGFLVNYKADDPAKPVRVKVANKQYAIRAGVGYARVHTTALGIDYSEKLEEVWHMPTFSHSLLSANKLRDEGHWFFSGTEPGDKNVYFAKKNKVWLVCKREGNLCYTDWLIEHGYSERKAYTAESIQSPEPHASPAVAASANRATDKESPALWHQRLGHVNMIDLQKLVKQGNVTGVKVSPSALGKHHSIKCQTCVMAKFNRAKFKRNVPRVEQVMHTLHSDITGPWPVASIGGGVYVLSLMDEASSRGGVSIIKSKDAAADELKRLILIWERDTGKKCHVLFTDRGGEYISNDFLDWCLINRIKHDYSAPRTPQQNGKAERFNQTIGNIMRSLMLNYKLHETLWGHAMIYACMIYNVMLNKRHGKTRHEVFFGTKPDLSKFRTFGCKVYAKVPDTARTKLEPKYQIGMFLGPEPDGVNYKVLTYNEKLKKHKYQVRIFRDIITYETLKAVTGAQDESQLHWGGHISLPEGQEITPPPPELESLTGEQEPSVDPLPEIRASEVGFPEEGGQVALPRLEGARLSEKQPVVVDAPALTQVAPVPLPLPCVAGQEALQPTDKTFVGEGAKPQDAGGQRTPETSTRPVRKVAKATGPAQNNVSPVTTVNKITSKIQKRPVPVKAKSVHNPAKVVHSKLKPRSQVITGAKVPVITKAITSVIANPITTTKIGTKRKPVDTLTPEVNPPYNLRSRSKSPVRTATPTASKPVGAPASVPATPTASKPVGASAPIVNIQAPAKPAAPALPFTNLPTSSKPVGAPIRITSHPVTTSSVPALQPTASKPVGAPQSGITRTGRVYLSANSAIPLPRGYSVVEPSAFFAEVPYEEPKLEKWQVEKLSQNDIVRGLMRTFDVEKKFDGPIRVISAANVTIPKTLKQAMNSDFAKEWAEATVEEWLSLVGNDTWTLVEKKPWMKVIPCKWIFTLKTDHDGVIERFKARLVAGGHRASGRSRL